MDMTKIPWHKSWCPKLWNYSRKVQKSHLQSIYRISSIFHPIGPLEFLPEDTTGQKTNGGTSPYKAPLAWIFPKRSFYRLATLVRAHWILLPRVIRSLVREHELMLSDWREIWAFFRQSGWLWAIKVVSGNFSCLPYWNSLNNIYFAIWIPILKLVKILRSIDTEPKLSNNKIL